MPSRLSFAHLLFVELCEQRIEIRDRARCVGRLLEFFGGALAQNVRPRFVGGGPCPRQKSRRLLPVVEFARHVSLPLVGCSADIRRTTGPPDRSRPMSKNVVRCRKRAAPRT